MGTKIKYFLIIFFALFIANKVSAQTDNIYLNGENYITLGSSTFPSKLEWTDASKERITSDASQFPIKTYWFSHNGNYYIVINLTTGKSDIYIELGDNKKAYHFPQDWGHSRQPGTYNDFTIVVENKSGALQKLTVSKGAHLSLNVVQIDPLNVKLSFSGTIVAYSNTDKSQLLIGAPSAPLSISGKVSLSKRIPDLAHLPDTYPGCDNTIYNEMSPDYGSGQYYTPTECEQSFYKKSFATLSNALSPALKYLAAQDWDMSSVPKYKPLEHRLLTKMNNFFQKDPGGSGVDYDLNITANPMKGAYHQYLQKVIQLSQQLGQGDPQKIKELETLQKEEPRKYKLHLQAFYNQPVQNNGQLDLSHAAIKKINDSLFLIENVESTGNSTIHDAGGAYLFVGKWTTPQFDDGTIVCSPIFQSGAKKLSIQAMYITISCGKELADKIISRINMNSLQELLKLQP